MLCLSLASIFRIIVDRLFDNSFTRREKRFGRLHRHNDSWPFLFPGNEISFRAFTHEVFSLILTTTTSGLNSIELRLRIRNFIQVLILFLVLFKATLRLLSFPEKRVVVDLLMKLLVDLIPTAGMLVTHFLFLVTL